MLVDTTINNKTPVKKAETKIVPIYVQIAISGFVPIRLVVGKNTIGTYLSPSIFEKHCNSGFTTLNLLECK